MIKNKLNLRKIVERIKKKFQIPLGGAFKNGEQQIVSVLFFLYFKGYLHSYLSTSHKLDFSTESYTNLTQ
jgi:hypothetical protein